jgi:uncharacterized NAD-dependent epimerase/dehydratase family protein
MYQKAIQTGRLAILLHDGILGPKGKTGLSLLRYSTAEIVAVIDNQCAGQSLPQLTGIPRDVPIVASVEAALAYNPTVLMIGIAPPGGALPDTWWTDLDQAINGGLSIANGLHTQLIPLIEQRNQQPLEALLDPGQWIWDIRKEPDGLPIASAAARWRSLSSGESLSCKRVLLVGTDMAIGKMSTCLELNSTALKRGIRSKFLATGQAGLMLGGDGVALDSVRVDFAAGAVEQMVMQFGSDYDLLFVEGQGSLLHPGSTATLPLLRGCQPNYLILAHKAGQTHIKNHPHVPIAPLPQVIQLYEQVASAMGAFEPAKVIGISLNTYGLEERSATEAIAKIQAETGLPCTDPVRFGADVLLDALS